MDTFEYAINLADEQSKFQKYSEHFTKRLQSESARQIYKHQKDAIWAVKEMNDKDNERGNVPNTIEPIVVVAPTGSGKSVIIFFLPYVLKSARVLIITPSSVITKQLAETFGVKFTNCFLQAVGLCPTDEDERKRYLSKVLEPGMILTSEQLKERPGNLVIINAQKLSGSSNNNLTPTERNPEVFPHWQEFFGNFDTLIVDEAHHYPATTWANILEVFKNSGDTSTKKVIFLTATPYRNDGGRQSFILGDDKKARIAHVIKPEEIEGICIRPKRFVEHNCSDVWTNEEEVPELFIRTLYQDINKIFRENLQEESRLINPQAMILVSRRTEATRIAAKLNKCGDRTFAIATLHGKPEPMKPFTEGKFKVAVTCGVGLEGYDNSNVILCIILRRIGEATFMLQQFVGRCARLNRTLGGDQIDRTTGIILSYSKFQVKTVYENMIKFVANYDPVEIEVVNDGGNGDDDIENTDESNESYEKPDGSNELRDAEDGNVECGAENPGPSTKRARPSFE